MFKIAMTFIPRISTCTSTCTPGAPPFPILSRRTTKTRFHGNPTFAPMYMQLCSFSQNHDVIRYPQSAVAVVVSFSFAQPQSSWCDFAETLIRPWRDCVPRAIPFHGCAREASRRRAPGDFSDGRETLISPLATYFYLGN